MDDKVIRARLYSVITHMLGHNLTKEQRDIIRNCFNVENTGDIKKDIEEIVKPRIKSETSRHQPNPEKRTWVCVSCNKEKDFYGKNKESLFILTKSNAIGRQKPMRSLLKAIKDGAFVITKEDLENTYNNNITSHLL